MQQTGPNRNARPSVRPTPSCESLPAAVHSEINHSHLRGWLPEFPLENLIVFDVPVELPIGAAAPNYKLSSIFNVGNADCRSECMQSVRAQTNRAVQR